MTPGTDQPVRLHGGTKCTQTSRNLRMLKGQARFLLQPQLLVLLQKGALLPVCTGTFPLPWAQQQGERRDESEVWLAPRADCV